MCWLKTCLEQTETLENKQCSRVFHEKTLISVVTLSNVRNNRISNGCIYAQIRKGLGMHLVTYTNRDTVPFLLLVQYKGGLSEIELTVSLFSNAGMILLSFLKILCIASYIKGGIALFCKGTL